MATEVFPARESNVIRLLMAGFVVMILLLITDGFVGFHTILSIRQSVSALAERQFVSVALIDEVQRAQSALGSILHEVSSSPEKRSRPQLGTRVESVEKTLQELFARVPASDPDIQLWREVENASTELTAEVDRILALPLNVNPDLSTLLRHRERSLRAVARLIRANHKHAEEAKTQIQRLTSGQLTEDSVLLGGCLLIACLSVWLVLRTVKRLYFRMTEQSEELSRVSWQLLERQEELAQRLSHELHDELGQSLTALKTNFSRHSASEKMDPRWLQDCSELLRDSIRSAHEISQLLRPTILDDFGLDSALSWLCERFEERNGIAVRYRSSFQGRLEAQVETHLFRIAQEALTNVSRHSGATAVEVSLESEGESVRLTISDNGTGLSPKRPASGRKGFGLTGMRARARALEGSMEIRSTPGTGTTIEMVCPRREVVYEAEDTHPVG